MRTTAGARAAAAPGPGGVPATLPERLLGVAIRLFAEKGFEGTSVREIVAAAGVTKGAMYHYFTSKDDLLFEIYNRLLTMQMARLEHFAGGSAGVEERLRAAATDVIETSFGHLDELTVFFRSVHLLPAERQARVRAARRRYHDRFSALLAEGQRAGVLRGDVPADIAAHYFFSALHQIGSWYHPGGRLDAAEVGAHYVDLLMDGLRARPATAPGAPAAPPGLPAGRKPLGRATPREA